MLIFKPETLLNLNRTCSNMGIDWVGDVRYATTSSANRLNLKSVVPIFTPSIMSVVRIKFASGSIQSVNNNGDSGHPCLVPRLIGNLFDFYY